jgi:hypothetical protein
MFDNRVPEQGRSPLGVVPKQILYNCEDSQSRLCSRNLLTTVDIAIPVFELDMLGVVWR